ncbi:MAG: type II toxin-antitoxin system PemK/MazF family toxin [Chroococcidiopsidaceae cyanobacterium CP_BM_RX_35]|nr:type II toxin-antitoxin system PemK/MazF family toxin [Chroococcidiopsidaceae cyanobacterium CP_BM_RX_35]
MTITPGDIWIAEILFTDDSASKKRPVLILWLDAQDVVVAAVTSASPRSVTDVILQDWQQSGLRVASVVRLARLDCLEQSLLVAQIGHISQADAQQLMDVWNSEVKPKF